jgi:hypothetical protein
MPRIEMTRGVKIALYFLRVYLIVLLALIGLKFWRTYSAPDDSGLSPQKPVAAAPAAP